MKWMDLLIENEKEEWIVIMSLIPYFIIVLYSIEDIEEEKWIKFTIYNSLSISLSFLFQFIYNRLNHPIS